MNGPGPGVTDRVGHLPVRQFLKRVATRNSRTQLAALRRLAVPRKPGPAPHRLELRSRSRVSHKRPGRMRHPQKGRGQLLRERELSSSLSPYLCCALRTLRPNLQRSPQGVVQRWATTAVDNSGLFLFTYDVRTRGDLLS